MEIEPDTSNQGNLYSLAAALASAYADALLRKEEVEDDISRLRTKIETLMREANWDIYDNVEVPIVITYKMKKSAERMKRGAKVMLRNMLTEEQWQTIYESPVEKPTLVIKKRRKSE